MPIEVWKSRIADYITRFRSCVNSKTKALVSMKPGIVLLRFTLSALIAILFLSPKAHATAAPEIVANDSLRMWSLLDSALQFRSYDLPRTLSLLEEGLVIAEEIEHTAGLATAYNRIGLVNMFLDNYPRSLESFIEAKALYHSLGDQAREATVNVNMAMLYYELGQYDKALSLNQESMKMRKSLGITGTPIATTLSTQANIRYMHLGDTLGALSDNAEARSIFLEAGSFADAAGCSANLAMIYIDLSQLDSAETYLRNSEDLLQKSTAQVYLPFVLHMKARLFEAKGKPDEAIEYAQQSLEKAESNQQIDQAKNTAFQLYQLYKNKGAYPEALDAHERYSKYVEQVESAEQKKFLADIEYRSLLSEKEFELQAKTERNELQTKITAYVGIALALSILLVIVLLYAYRRNRSNSLILYKQKRILEEQAAKLERIDRDKTRLFGVISHDLRGPISNLGGLLNLMKDDKLSREDFNALSERLSHHFGHLSDSLTNLLLWANSQMNENGGERKSFNLSEAADEAMQLLHSHAQEKKVMVQNTISESMMAHADPEQVKVIFRNLLSNAIKFTPEGGSVHISASEGFQGHLRVSVRDNGLGIPEDIQNRLLLREENVSTYGTSGERGTGLGLSLCHDYVEANGGEMWFESTENEGSNFIFTLRAAEIGMPEGFNEAQAS